MNRRFFCRKIVGSVELGHLELGVGPQLDKTLSGQPIGSIRFQPKSSIKRVRAIFERYGNARCEVSALAAHRMIVIEFRTAHPHGDIENTILRMVAGLQETKHARKHVGFLFGNLVADIVRRRVRFLFQLKEVAIQFRLENLGQRLRLGECGRGEGENDGGSDDGVQSLGYQGAVDHLPQITR